MKRISIVSLFALSALAWNVSPSLACNTVDHGTCSKPLPSFDRIQTAQGEAIQAQSTFSTEALRQASGGSLAALWRQNRQELLKPQPSFPKVSPPLQFVLPKHDPNSSSQGMVSKAYQGGSARGNISFPGGGISFNIGPRNASLRVRLPNGKGPPPEFMALFAAILQLGLSQHSMNSAGMGLPSGSGLSQGRRIPCYPRSQIPLMRSPQAQQTPVFRPQGSAPQDVAPIFGVGKPGANLTPQGSGSPGWLGASQPNKATPTGPMSQPSDNDPAPASATNLTHGWVSHHPTSGFPKITRGFGRKFHPIHKRWKTHSGIDISKRRGSGPKAYATGPATVEFVGRKGGYGNTVILKHANGYRTLYAHLSRRGNVRRNTSIPGGTVLGNIGMTGTATGPHLHFEVSKNGKKTNPKPFFPKYPYAN